ncbi:lactonase family protein [Silvibacterium sp.]|uniref:lactonase family protein n=1 Tax=Silvibacterium sp. TaxID=1964179 RepID=UPI0039E44312
MNRRRFLRTAIQSAAVAPLAARGWRAFAADAGQQLLYVGTQTLKPSTSQGIYAYSFDAATGTLTQKGLAAWGDNPTYLVFSPDKKYLYACNEIDHFGGAKSGGVSAFAVDADAAKLNFLNAVPSEGYGTTHIAIDHTGKAVFAASYDSGSAASFHVEPDGRVSMPVSHFQYTGHGPDASRQTSPHAHWVTVSPDNRYLFVNDLGLDCIHIYKLDAATAKLTPNTPDAWHSDPGAGPRSLLFHPNGKVAYCVEEMASVIAVLNWDAAKGSLTTVQKISTRTENWTGPTATGCKMVLTHDGLFGYACDRGDNNISSFKVDPETGKLSLLGRTPCGGDIPRHIALDKSEKWLLVANQVSDTISVIARDSVAGTLAATSKTYPISRPQCLLFY